MPFSVRLRGATPEVLDPLTAFGAGPFRVAVRFIGTDSTYSETTDNGIVHIRHVSNIELRLMETGLGGTLQALVDGEDKSDVLALLGSFANRVLRAIRNGGLFSQAKEIAFRPWQAESLLREWKCEISRDGSKWTPLFAARGPLWELLGALETPRSLTVDLWPEIEELIQDDLRANPEQEFLTNSIGHMNDYNFRLALIESIVCLEIVLSQFLQQFLLVSKQLSQNRVDFILNPQVGLSARVAVLLDLVLSVEELKSVQVPQILKAVNWRNAIIHKTGHLPTGISDDEARECIFATLELALFLGRKRDQIAATPQLGKLAQEIATKYGVPTPTIQASHSHRVSVSFGGFLASAIPPEAKILEIVSELVERLKVREKRFIANDHLHVSFGALLGSARAVWSKGHLEIIPSGISFLPRSGG